MDYTRDRRILAEAEAAGEPVIVLRAKDKLAAGVVGHYLDRAVAEDCDQAFLVAVDRRLVEFEEWKIQHSDQVKVPDLRPDEPV